MKMRIASQWGKVAALILGLSSLGAFGVTNDLSTALSKGLFEEEANHNFDAAIRMYQSVIDRFDDDRKLAATAVFRLGECYRKQGSTNQATAQYQRVLREFADQTPLVTLSRQNLVVLGGGIQSGQTNLSNGVTQRLANVVDAGEISRVQSIIQNSPDLINAPDASGQTLLQTYAGKGDLPVVELLLQNGAAVNGIKQPELTPLHFAAGNGRKSVVEFLLSKGAKVDAVTPSGVTPLHLAVSKGYEQVAKVLLDAGANVNSQVQSDVSRTADSMSYSLHAYQSPLHLACQEGYGGLVDLLISKGAEVNVLDDKGATPLTMAAQANNENAVKALLEAHADPSAGRWSALSLAAGQGNLALLDLLLSHPANLNLSHALTAAVKDGRAAAVSRLIHSKADPNSKYSNGEPLVFDALNSPSVLKALLDGGADPNQKSVQGDTLLERAVSGSHEVLELLLAHGADPNIPDTSHGYTALHYAAGNSALAAAQALLDHGAKPNVEANDGETSLHFAVKNRNQEMASLLLDHGADPNVRNSSGETPYDIARRVPLLPGHPSFPLLGGQTLVQTPPLNPRSMQDILLQHGATLDLPHMDQIEIRRGQSYSSAVFTRSTNDLNRFSVLELIAVHYGFVSTAPTVFGGSIGIPEYNGQSRTIRGALPFPDLEKIEIRRPKGGKEWAMIRVPVQQILESGDCSRDVWLEWGDQVNVPEADHPLDAAWHGFSVEILTNLQKCIQRTVTVIIKSQTNALSLEAPQPKSQWGGLPSQFNYSPVQFSLSPALQRSGLLRSSSDLAHIKVKRHNSATGENWEKTFDCSGATPLPTLWLRDGDVIDVPDRP